MMQTITAFFLFICLNSTAISQQSGNISGKILDNETGEKIVGANILVEGTMTGAATDIDGLFVIKNLKPGTYSLRVSNISYATLIIKDVVIERGKTTQINVSLKPEAIAIDGEIIVSAEASSSYEAALLNQMRKSVAIMDGISAEQIKKSTDATTAEALKRVSGVTISEGKYVFVRGTNERYSAAQLNNSPLASTEPDKRTFAFDLIPSNLIDNSVIIKSFTPDNPGDFVGGLIKVNTIDFPSKMTINFSYSTSFIDGVTSKSFASSSGGKTDWLGLDDGTRELPESLPDDVSILTPVASDSFARSEPFPNNWKVLSKKAPINQTFSLSYGDKFSVLGSDLGIISSVFYKNNYNKNSTLKSAPSIFEMTGTESNYSVLWGGIVKFGYKFSDYHKIGFQNSFTVNSDDEVFQLYGEDLYRYQNQYRTGLRFVSRSLYSGQLSGESFIPVLNKGITVQWRGSYSNTRRDEPDYRRYTYARAIDAGESTPYRMVIPVGPDLAAASRFFSLLKEIRRDVGADITIPLGFSSVKIGGSFQNSNRNFSSRLFNIYSTTSYKRDNYAIDSIFNSKYFGWGSLLYTEYRSGTNFYSNGDEITAFYGMIDLPFQLINQEFRIITGARSENWLLRLRTMSSSYTYPITVDRHENDILASFTLIYKLSETSNIRLSYSNTINRPELRETAPFFYFDFQTQTSIWGNENLKHAKIRNYDFRYEIFPAMGEVFSFSLFYKRLEDAIERSIVDVSSGEVSTFTNAPLAKNFGFEVETRMSPGHITELLSNFTVSLNYSWIKSEVDNVLGVQESIKKAKRPLQGQSPYIINFSLNYTQSGWGTSATLLYNRIGRRVNEVASQYLSDIYEEPCDLIDIVLSQALTSYTTIKMTIKDLLARDRYQTLDGKKIRSISGNTTYSLGISFNL